MLHLQMVNLLHSYIIVNREVKWWKVQERNDILGAHFFIHSHIFFLLPLWNETLIVCVCTYCNGWV